MLQGFKTILVGLAWVVLPPAVDYIGNIDWTKYVDPKWAPIAAGVSMILMRLVTTTGVFKK